MSVSLFNFLVIFIGWNFFGCVCFIIVGSCNCDGAIGLADGWEFVNPVHVHEYNHVNWFGAIVVALFYNLLCPVGSLVYWVYKLCTVGRE